MTIKELESLMIQYGVVLRTIPKVKTSIFETYHVTI